MSEKAPAFQFYPKDFLSDRKVVVMSPEARGMYITLLCIDWLEDGFPETDLMVLAGYAPQSHGTIHRDKIEAQLKQCFSKHPTKDSFVTNPRLQKERQKQIQYRHEKSKAGKLGVEAKKLKRLTSEAQLKHGLSNGSANASSSSPSSSSSSDLDRERGLRAPWSDCPKVRLSDLDIENFQMRLGAEGLNPELDKPDAMTAAIHAQRHLESHPEDTRIYTALVTFGIKEAHAKNQKKPRPKSTAEPSKAEAAWEELIKLVRRHGRPGYEEAAAAMPPDTLRASRASQAYTRACTANDFELPKVRTAFIQAFGGPSP